MAKLLEKIIKAIIEVFKSEGIPTEEIKIEEPKKIEVSLEQKIQKYIEDLIYTGSGNPFNKKPYMEYRETNANNRSPELDAMIKRNGGQLGDPYCLYGQQDMLRCIENQFKIKFDLPKTGSTQKFWADTKAEYRVTNPRAFSIGIYQKGSEWKGHAVLSFGPINPKEFSTFEFNTSPAAGPEIVRDGQGCYFKTRPMNGYGDMKLKGFVDIFKAIKQ